MKKNTEHGPSREDIIAGITDAFDYPSIRNQKRLNALLNLHLKSGLVTDETAVFGFVPEDWCLNHYDGVHGGITASVFDTCMGFTAHAACGALVTTTNLSLDFLRPMTGKSYTVYVEYTHIGRTLISEYARMVDDATGELCAVCTGSYMIIGKVPHQ